MAFDTEVLQERLRGRSYDLFKGCWGTFTGAARNKEVILRYLIS